MKVYKIGILLIILLLAMGAASAEKIHASSDDLVTYYGPDTPAGDSGYTFSIEVDGDVYYLEYYDETTLADISDNVKDVLEWDLKTNYMNDDIDIRNSLGMKIGSIEVLDEGSGTTMFSFPLGEDVSFTYSDGHTVGFNTNAKIIDEIDEQMY